MFESFSYSHLLMITRGVMLTIVLCIISGILGTLWGLILGVGATIKNLVVRKICKGYVKILRGIPLLIILFFIYFAVPIITGMHVSKFVASILGLTLYAGAYIGEIVRGSIEAVPKGQFEASQAIAFNTLQQYRYIVLPQAFRIMIPSLIGFLIALVKDSSLVSVIGYIDLTRAGRNVANLTMQPLLTFMFVALYYFILCFLLARLGTYAEIRMKRS